VAREPRRGGVEFAPRELAVDGDEGRRVGAGGKALVEQASEFDLKRERRTGERHG
jgi:hypothetical protein